MATVITYRSCSKPAALNAAASDEAQQVVQGNSASLVAWLVLNIWPSHLGLPLLIITILLARNIRRHATFINFCVAWIIVGVSSSLLLYAGFQTGPEPPRLLCLTQASLLYGQPGLTSVSAFSLVFQVFYVMRAAFQERDPEYHKTLRKWTLLIFPYVSFVVFSTWTAFVRSEFLALFLIFILVLVKDSGLTNSITGFSLGVLLATIFLELWILYIIISHWRTIRSNGMGANIGMDLSLICRIVAFTLWLILGVSLSALSIKAPRSPVPDIALATMGSAVVLVFGTQRDILRAWMFWKRNKVDKRDIGQPSALPLDRSDSNSDSPSSSLDHSIKPQTSEPANVEEGSVHEVQHRRSWRDRFMGRKVKGQLTTKDISPPILRNSLTFTVFGQAI